jgi:hypothetical protein
MGVVLMGGEDVSRYLVLAILFNTGALLLLLTTWRTTRKDVVWYPLAAAVQYAAALGCYALAAAIAGWL